MSANNLCMSGTGHSKPSAKETIEMSRQTMKAHLETSRAANSDAAQESPPDAKQHEAHQAREDSSITEAGIGQTGIDPINVLRELAEQWWKHHPLHGLMRTAEPAISQIVRRKPLQALGISSALGAGFILMRPWRRVSLFSGLSALISTSNISGALLGVLSVLPKLYK